jgi:lipid A ethanolaminephosphotransferase
MLHKKTELPSELLLVIVVSFLLIFANNSFWHRLSAVIGPFSAAPWTYLSVFLLMLSLMGLLFALITPKWAIKWMLCSFLMIAAGTSYFMDNYGAVIDRHAIQSVLESDTRESMEWLSISMLWPILGIGLLPSVWVLLFTEVRVRSLSRAIAIRSAFISVCALCTVFAISTSYQSLASVARNHPTLRDLINPFNAVNAVRGYIRQALRVESSELRAIGADAKLGKTWATLPRKPMLFVIVVGESTRAASFGLLGYPRDTTPELAKLPLVLFGKVSACGTNTATSVPCLFSNLGRANYEQHVANSQENVLDIIHRAGFTVEWIDNNTGSKRVASRLIERSVANDTDPILCTTDSCHDEVLVRELANKLDSIESDTVLVLHQLGSHGPAYFQRYPDRFAKFSPQCKSVDLHKCSEKELLNSYDNTVLYTDFVLASMIDKLASRPELNSALFFVSDHGESTGESGFFLHGTPYAIAPKEQTEVPMFFWFSDAFKAQRLLAKSCADTARDITTSHDAVFPMLLGVLDISTSAYSAEVDPLSTCYTSGLSP